MQLARSVIAGSLAFATAAAPACTRGPVVEIVLPSATADLDPHRHGGVSAFEVASHFYEPLVALDDRMRPIPALAESWHNPDPLTWVFTLRRGVRFHDGSGFTSADVAWTFERLLADPSLASRVHIAAVRDFEVPAPDRIVVRTRWPAPLFASRLHFVMVARHGSDPATLRVRANGTGRFRLLDGWTPGGAAPMRLVRNRSYWGKPPAVAAATLSFGLATPDVVAGLAAGRFTLVRSASSEFAAAARAAGRYDISSNSNIFLRHLGFGLGDASSPLSDPRLREAIDLALDRSRIAAAVSSTAVPAGQIVPRAIVGHDPGRGLPTPNLARARALLAAAGFGNGLDLVLHRPNGYAKAAAAVASQLAEVGLRVRVESLPSEEFFARLRRGELGFWLVATGATTGDAMELLEAAFHSRHPELGLGLDNHGRFEDRELDRAIEEVRGLFDTETRGRALLPLLQRVLDARVWIPLYHDDSRSLVSRDFRYRPRGDDYFRLENLEPRP